MANSTEIEVQEESPPLPSQEECPDCIYGVFYCPRHCTDNLRGYYFDFAYHAGDCWEEIPSGESSVMLDLGVWCMSPPARGYLDCDRMKFFAFRGISILGSCISSPHGASLVHESCYWECKHGRPVARCRWEFDHERRLQVSGQLEACWIEERCSSNSLKVEVIVVCRPTSGFVHPSKQDDALKELARAQLVLKNVNRSHASMAHELLAVRETFVDELTLWSDALHSERGEHNETRERLEATRTSLESANRERQRLTFGILGTVVLCIALATLALALLYWVCRRWRALLKKAASEERGTFVVGCPVVPVGNAEEAVRGAANDRNATGLSGESSGSSFCKAG